MTTTYKWTIDNLAVVPSLNGMDNVVSDVFVTISAVLERESGRPVVRSWSQSVKIGAPTGNFVRFEELTKDMVIGWVQQVMGTEQVESIKTSLEKQIQHDLNPPILYKTPPSWNTIA